MKKIFKVFMKNIKISMEKSEKAPFERKVQLRNF